MPAETEDNVVLTPDELKRWEDELNARTTTLNADIEKFNAALEEDKYRPVELELVFLPEGAVIHTQNHGDVISLPQDWAMTHYGIHCTFRKAPTKKDRGGTALGKALIPWNGVRLISYMTSAEIAGELSARAGFGLLPASEDEVSQNETLSPNEKDEAFDKLVVPDQEDGDAPSPDLVG